MMSENPENRMPLSQPARSAVVVPPAADFEPPLPGRDEPLPRRARGAFEDAVPGAFAAGADLVDLADFADFADVAGFAGLADFADVAGFAGLAGVVASAFVVSGF